MNPSYVCKIGENHYFRRKIQGRAVYRPLPHPADRRFKHAYQQAHNELDRLQKGVTFAALIREYEKSPAYRQLSHSTRRNKNTFLTLFNDRFSKLPVGDLMRHDVYALQSEFEDTPGKANGCVSHMCTLLGFAMDRGFCGQNVATNMKRLKGGQHKPWPEAVIQKALAAASPVVRLAIITALESGQRIGDCISITHNQVDTGMVELTQQKTKCQVCVPVSKRWRAEIANVPREADTILYNCYKKKFRSPERLQALVRELMATIGEPEYTLHGLRRNATNRLVELGFTPSQIGAVTGMTIPTIVHYTRGSNAKRIAKQMAMLMSE